MPDPNEVPIKIPDNTLKRIGKAMEAYAERRLEDIAPDVPESVASDVKKIVAGWLTGETHTTTVSVDLSMVDLSTRIGAETKNLLPWLLAGPLRPLLLKTKLLSKYFGEEMLETSFEISYDLESFCESENLLEEYYMWLVDVMEAACDEARNLITENLVEGPPKPEPALDALVDLAVAETLAEADHETLTGLVSEDGTLDLEFSRLRIPEPPHPLDEDELMNQVAKLRVAIRSTLLDMVISSSASSVLGLCLVSPILINRGVSKEWIVKVVGEALDPSLRSEFTDLPPYDDYHEIFTKLVEGKEEDIVKETTEKVLERLKSELEKSTKRGTSLSELGLNDVESFLLEVARRVAKMTAENVRLARTLLVDERERVAENLLSADRVLRIGGETIPPEALDPGWEEAGGIESVSVSDLAEKAVEDVMDSVLDVARKVVGLEGSSGGERSSLSGESPSKRSSGGRESEGSLSDFVWDVAQTVMKEIVRELTSDKKRR